MMSSIIQCIDRELLWPCGDCAMIVRSFVNRTTDECGVAGSLHAALLVVQCSKHITSILQEIYHITTSVSILHNILHLELDHVY